MTVPAPTCPHGYTEVDLAGILGERLDHFNQWMSGQTMSVCDGKRYSHEDRAYYPTECADDPHGPVVFPWDLHKYLGI